MTRDRKSYLVYQFGGVWKMSLVNYKRFLNCGAAGQEFNIEDYGKRLGEVDAHMPTDWQPADFFTKLEDLKRGE
jgi:hypothetical protein